MATIVPVESWLAAAFTVAALGAPQLEETLWSTVDPIGGRFERSIWSMLFPVTVTPQQGTPGVAFAQLVTCPIPTLIRGFHPLLLAAATTTTAAAIQNHQATGHEDPAPWQSCIPESGTQSLLSV